MPPTLAALAARLRARGRGEVLELPVSRLRELDGGRGEVALRLAEGLQVTRVGELLDALGDGDDSPQIEGREARLLARELWAWATRLPLRATVTWEPGEAVAALAIPDVPVDADGLGEWAARHGVVDLLDETVCGLGDVSLAQFAPDMTLASLWRPGAVPRLVRPEFYAYLVHQAKEAAAAHLGARARARALAEARARVWAEAPAQRGPRELASHLRAALTAAAAQGEAPPLLREGTVWVDCRAATVHYARDDSGERVRLELADSGGGGIRIVPCEASDDPGLTRALLAWALDGLHDRAHPLHAALAAIGQSGAWERTLRGLEALRVGRGAEAAEADEARDRRLVWRVDVRHHQVQVQPAIQRRMKGERWSRGQGRPVAALAEDPEVTLGAADHAVHDPLLLLEQRTRRGGGLQPGDVRHEIALLRALVDNPRVVAADEPRILLRVRERPPTLVVRDEPEGMTLHLRIGGASVDLEQLERDAHPGCIAALDLDAAVCWFCPRAPLIDDLCALLLDARAPIPEAGHVALLAALEPLQPALRLELAPRLAGPEAPASLGLEVVVAEVEGAAASGSPALELSLRAQPLPDLLRPIDPAAWAPGEGPALRFGLREGERAHVTRDLEGERRRAAQLLARLGLGSRDGGPSTFRIAELDRALDLLQALERMAADDPSLRVRWAAGQRPWRVSKRASAADVRVRVERSGEWLGVDGDVDLGGEAAPLADVLAATRVGRRYLELGDRRYAEITPELRRRLSRSDEAIFNYRGELAVGDTMVEAVTELVDDRSRLMVDPAARQLLARLEAARSLSTRLPAAFEGVLRDYQIAGFHWLMQLAAWSAGACLADEMGLGKTVQALAVLAARGDLGPALVVAPTSVCRGWLAECERFAPELRPRLYHGPRRAQLRGAPLGRGDLLITSYDVVARDAEALAAVTFASVVLDEAQAVKNARTRRARAIRSLRADWRVALTGTPIENHLGELWSLMHTVSPGLLGTWEHFRERFAAPIERDTGSPARDRLRRLLDPYVLRRTKGQVAPELPPRTEVIDAVELSAEERALYEETRAAVVDALAGADVGEPGRFAVLAAITRLRQLACHPRLVDPGSTAPSAKLRRLLALVDDLRREGHRALVFSQFTSHLALVREALRGAAVEHLYFDGSTPAARRAALVERWQRGDGAVFLISLQAGGAGINLTAADYVIHLDPWWNPAVEDQASDRAHRIGQTRPVTVVRLVSQGTIEETVLELHGTKRSLAESLLSGDGSVTKLSADDLLGLLRAGATEA